MFLLDTCFVSESRKISAGKANPGATVWLSQADEDSLYLSAIVVQELAYGALLAQRSDPCKGQILSRWLYQIVLPRFAGRILPVNEIVALEAARLSAPIPRPVRDGLIAATAIANKMTVVTHNVADFQPTGVQIINPWT